MDKKRDLSYGRDCRGDLALFIEERHVSGWAMSEEVAKFLRDEKNLKKQTSYVFDRTDGSITKKIATRPVFFRVIENGIETSFHGEVDLKNGNAVITQVG